MNIEEKLRKSDTETLKTIRKINENTNSLINSILKDREDEHPPYALHLEINNKCETYQYMDVVFFDEAGKKYEMGRIVYQDGNEIEFYLLNNRKRYLNHKLWVENGYQQVEQDAVLMNGCTFNLDRGILTCETPIGGTVVNIFDFNKDFACCINKHSVHKVAGYLRLSKNTRRIQRY